MESDQYEYTEGLKYGDIQGHFISLWKSENQHFSTVVKSQYYYNIIVSHLLILRFILSSFFFFHPSSNLNVLL